MRLLLEPTDLWLLELIQKRSVHCKVKRLRLPFYFKYYILRRLIGAEAQQWTLLASGSSFLFSFFLAKWQFWHYISTSIIIKQFCFHSSSILLDRGYFIIISFLQTCRLFHIHMFNLISFMSGKRHNAYIKRNTIRHWEKKLSTIIHILWPRDII